MTPLHPSPFVLGDRVRLSWASGSEDLPATIRRFGTRRFGPVMELVVDDGAVAALGCGDLLRVDVAGRGPVSARVLHVETRWRTQVDRVKRSPSVLTVMMSSVEEGVRPRRFVRVHCALEVEMDDGAFGRRHGQCVLLSPRGMVVHFHGPTPRLGEVVVGLTLPRGQVWAHGWVATHELGDTGSRIGMVFTNEASVTEAVTEFVLGQGFTPVPVSLAG